MSEPVFSHGMLYVAFSRSVSKYCMLVLVKDTKKWGKLNDT